MVEAPVEAPPKRRTIPSDWVVRPSGSTSGQNSSGEPEPPWETPKDGDPKAYGPFNSSDNIPPSNSEPIEEPKKTFDFREYVKDKLTAKDSVDYAAVRTRAFVSNEIRGLTIETAIVQAHNKFINTLAANLPERVVNAAKKTTPLVKAEAKMLSVIGRAENLAVSVAKKLGDVDPRVRFILNFLPDNIVEATHAKLILLAGDYVNFNINQAGRVIRTAKNSSHIKQDVTEFTAEKWNDAKTSIKPTFESVQNKLQEVKTTASEIKDKLFQKERVQTAVDFITLKKPREWAHTQLDVLRNKFFPPKPAAPQGAPI